jgi:hypothetical protein
VITDVSQLAEAVHPVTIQFGSLVVAKKLVAVEDGVAATRKLGKKFAAHAIHVLKIVVPAAPAVPAVVIG